jgi:hypothetical protein
MTAIPTRLYQQLLKQNPEYNQQLEREKEGILSTKLPPELRTRFYQTAVRNLARRRAEEESKPILVKNTNEPPPPISFLPTLSNKDSGSYKFDDYTEFDDSTTDEFDRTRIEEEKEEEDDEPEKAEYSSSSSSTRDLSPSSFGKYLEKIAKKFVKNVTPAKRMAGRPSVAASDFHSSKSKSPSPEPGAPFSDDDGSRRKKKKKKKKRTTTDFTVKGADGGNRRETDGRSRLRKRDERIRPKQYGEGAGKKNVAWYTYTRAIPD